MGAPMMPNPTKPIFIPVSPHETGATGTLLFSTAAFRPYEPAMGGYIMGEYMWRPKKWGTAFFGDPPGFFYFLPQPVRLASVRAGLYVRDVVQVKWKSALCDRSIANAISRYILALSGNCLGHDRDSGRIFVQKKSRPFWGGSESTGKRQQIGRTNLEDDRVCVITV